MQRWFRKHRAIVLNTYIRSHLLLSRNYTTRTTFFNKNPTESLPEKLSTYFSNLLTEQHDKMLDQPVQKLINKVPNLARDLRKSIDIENKLFTVLSYDPVLIDPRLYLHFYDPSVGAPVKKLMLERLLYHQQYAACWQLFIGDTLDDLDVFLETTESFIKKSGNDFAVIDLVISLPQLGENESYRTSVLDALAHTFNIDVRQILQTYYEINDLRNINNLLAYSKNDFTSTVLRLKQTMRVLYYEGTTSRQVQEVLLQNPDIMIRPGWISSIFPKFEFWSCMVFPDLPRGITPFIDAVKVILSKGVRLSDMDTLYMLHSNASPFSIFSVYKLSIMQKSILNYLVRLLVESSNHEELKAAYLVTRKQLELPVIIDCVNKLLENEISVLPLIKHFEKSKREKIVMGLKYHNASNFMELIVYFNNNQKIARYLITTFTNTSHANIENLTLLATSNINSKRTLLEIFRSTLLRANTIDQNFISVVLNVILQKTVPDKGGFNKSYDSLNQKQRSIMHNTFRSIGQTLSLLSDTDLAHVMDGIYNMLHDGSFYYKNDKTAQKYLFKLLSNEVFRFVMRKEERVKILQDTMGQMTTSTYWVKYWLIYSMVLDDFSNAIKLLEFYNSSKRELIQFFPAITLGIIHSKQMEINSKVKYLDYFLERAKRHQYKNVLKLKAGMEIIRQLQKAAKDEKLNNDSVRWLATISQKNRYMRRAIYMNSRVREKTNIH
ncbi:hypothetical protein CORT_0E05760 [Candida orthopsilosis Co 90-125]|uniref:Uncharacterized protein n=2 Tax=Candida orthopsilosis TaxID=273371 RepID=H8X861_CANO9|nr:hypothetical protein CORT_0E05760 [Candida orthopsilosis Co 90-125]ADY62692.1 orf19.3202 [Candida orthopsilosis]CCG24160.1 hypothetical protein CORT_0E05760 [Candida orthopsilosis Co 90-125]